ncbi:MAG: toxin [Candidatus Rokuibacteriota bacterium]
MDYRYDARKDAWLRRERGRGFETIIRAIEAGGLLRVLPNPSYPGQAIAEVLVAGYVYRVPFRSVAGGTRWELITLYPDRRATRAWRTRGGSDEPTTP